MANFHVFPKGDDRTWTREFYYAMNRIARRCEYENRGRIEQAIKDLVLYGNATLRIDNG